MAKANSLNVSPTTGTAVIGNGTGFTTLGYSSSPTASNLVERDAHGGVFAASLNPTLTTTASTTTVTLTAASSQIQNINNSGVQVTVVLPDATTLSVGSSFTIHPTGTAPAVIETNGGATLYTIGIQGYAQFYVTDNTTSVGTWNVTPYLPSPVYFGTDGLTMTGPIVTTGRVQANSLNPNENTIYGTGGLTTLTYASAQVQYIIAGPEDIKLPLISALFPYNLTYYIINESGSTINVLNNAGTILQTMDQSTQVIAREMAYSGGIYDWYLQYFSNTSGSGISFTGDTGTPFTTKSVAVISNQTGNNAGSSVLFNASNPNLTLDVTDASNNTLIGQSSGNLTLTGNNNTSLGLSSLAGLTSGSFNVSGGSTSLSSLLTGQYNSALGYGAGGNYVGAESSNVLLNSAGVVAESHVLRAGTGTGTGTQQLSKAYISGIANPTLSAGSPTPYLVSQDISDDQLQCLTPVDAATASAAFGSLAVGTALQNTSNYPILVNVSMAITASTTAVILVGVGSTNTPTAQAVTASFTVAAFTVFNFSFVVPAKYYARVTTTGTITVGSITTFASQIG